MWSVTMKEQCTENYFVSLQLQVLDKYHLDSNNTNKQWFEMELQFV